MDATDDLSEDNSLADLLAHPALRPFASHLLPTPDCPTDMALADVGSLMPWHTEINPRIIIKSLNRLKNDANAGKTVFYSFSARAHTGLFLFRGRKHSPFALVCPGGGFRYLGTLHEGLPIARVISEGGFSALVLQYRCGGERIACKDMAVALGWIHAHARELDLDPANYSIWGCSAGARMAADLGTYGAYDLGGPELPAPRAVIMAYTSHVWHSPEDPPTFAVVGENDEIAPPWIMARRVAEMRANGIDAELRVFPDLAHGFGAGDGTAAEGWVGEGVSFWQKQTAMRPAGA